MLLVAPVNVHLKLKPVLFLPIHREGVKLPTVLVYMLNGLVKIAKKPVVKQRPKMILALSSLMIDVKMKILLVVLVGPKLGNVKPILGT